MSALTKAMSRSRSIVTSAQSRALEMKRSGVMGSVMGGSPNVNPFYSSSNRSRQQYSFFRGWLYAAINAIASEAAAQPVVMGKMKKEDKKKPKDTKSDYFRHKMTPAMQAKAARHEMEVVEDHPLIKALEHPNDIQHRWQFVYSFVANLLITGWAYVVGGENENGEMEFFSLPTTWIEPDHTDGPFSKFRIINPHQPRSDQHDTEPLTRENVAFAHLPNPSDPLSALAPSTAQIMSIRIDDHMQTSQERFFENGIFPSVIVTVGKDPHPDVPEGIRPRLNAPQRRQVMGAIRKVMGGVSNYGNPAIVDGLIEKIERLSATQNEMGWEKSEDKIKNRILSAYCVHPYVLGEPTSVGGYAQAAKIEERFCKRVNTYLDMLGTVMSNYIGTTKKKKDDDLTIWWEKCEPHDPALKWTNLRFARQNDDISQNEFRAMLGLPPDDDRNESVLQKQALGGIIQLLGQVGSGAVKREQAIGILEALGLPSEAAEQIAGPEPTEEEIAAQQQPEGFPGGSGNGFGGGGRFGGGNGNRPQPRPPQLQGRPRVQDREPDSDGLRRAIDALCVTPKEIAGEVLRQIDE